MSIGTLLSVVEKEKNYNELLAATPTSSHAYNRPVGVTWGRIGGNVLKWTEDWLNGRKPRVILNGNFSSGDTYILVGLQTGKFLAISISNLYK